MATSFTVQKNARNEAIALQAKAKALREQQRARIDGRHKYMLGLVADRLELELSLVEDFMLDGDQVSLTVLEVHVGVDACCNNVI